MVARTPAMLLAAGRGERMRPLTDSTPKPLLAVCGKPLLQWHLQALRHGGFGHAVINTAWLGEQIQACFGSSFPAHLPDAAMPLVDTELLKLSYSEEGHDFGHALETAGGIARALPMLFPACAATASTDIDHDVFWVLAADVYTPDFVFSQEAVARFATSGKLAHLWLVPNPEQHPRGDFGLDLSAGNAQGIGLALNLPAHDPGPRYTYSTIGLYRKALFSPPWCDIPHGNPQGLKTPLAPLLRRAMDNALVSAELYRGAWTDVGTPERLQALCQTPANNSNGLP
jgi:MurNAc alpha-1-phosphate uridylyltransferase